MADIGLDLHHEKDMRPRVVRYAEQQLRQGWELVIYHDSRTACWRRGAETLNASYGYAGIVLEYFGNEFGEQIIEVTTQKATIEPPTTQPSSTEEEMTVKTKDEVNGIDHAGERGTTVRRDQWLVFENETYTFSEICEMTGLPKHRLRDANKSGRINTFLGPTSDEDGRVSRHVRIDDAFVKWLIEFQRWTGTIELAFEKTAASASADGMPDADQIEITAGGKQANEGADEDTVDKEVNRVRAAVERVKADKPPLETLPDAEFVTPVLEHGRVRVREYVYACPALDHPIYKDETVLAHAPLTGPMPLEIPITTASGMFIGTATRYFGGEEASMLTIGGQSASEWMRKSTLGAATGGDEVPDGWTKEEVDKAAFAADRLAAKEREDALTRRLAQFLEDVGSGRVSMDQESVSLDQDKAEPEAKPYQIKAFYRDNRTTEQWLVEELANARGAYERALVLADDDARADAWREVEKAESDAHRYLRTLDESRRRIRKALRRPIGHLFTW